MLDLELQRKNPASNGGVFSFQTNFENYETTYSEAIFSTTCLAEGLVIALPSEKTSVGTVRLPPFTFSTISAVPGTSSILISSKVTPRSASWDFKRLQ